MFSFIATVIGIGWVMEHKVETCFILAAIIFLIYRIATHGKRQARKAQLAAQQRAAEAARQREEEKKASEAAIQKAITDRENAISKAIASSPGSEKYRSSVPFSEVNYNILTISDFKLQSHGKYTVLDFETTGLDSGSDHIVEIGACKVDGGKIVSQYHEYCDPGVPMPAAASEVNHITDQMLSGKPKIYELLPGLLTFIGDDIIVAHNASFDMRFLAQACMTYRFVFPGVAFDSMQLIELWPELKSRKLSSFLGAANIENKQAHSAIGDAEALANLMIVSMKKPYRITVPSDFDFGFSTGHFTGSVDPVDDKLKGKRFVITGEIEGYEREDFEKMIASHGGKCSLKISSATDYLIVGVFKKLPDEYVSAKEEYAQKLIAEGGKIQIISPADLYRMIGQVVE